MPKFNSWLNNKPTKSDDGNRGKPELTSEDTQGTNQSEKNTLPKTKLVKTKRLFHGLRKFSSGMLGKISGGRRKPLYRRYLFWAGLGVTSGIIAFNHGISEIDKTLPDKAELNTVIREQTLTIKAADGTILQQRGEATREQLNLEEIPDVLKQAFIASEDRRFWKHGGVDYQGIARAVYNNIRSENLQGGSTITQQLARILFLKQERTYWRKLKEFRLAQNMEEELTKNEILERYLNLVYLGSGAYGVADAAWVYFSKSVDELTLGEAATIAGLTPAPSVFSPIQNPEAAKRRRNLVLQRMFEDGVITKTQKQEAFEQKIVLKPNQPKRLDVKAPYFTSYIHKELPKFIPPEVIKAGGLTVETTLNPKWQKFAEATITKVLKRQGKWQRFKQAALVAIDPRNGEIKAMVGGKDFDKNQFNRVTQAQRQPGSTFKGFVYAAAIASGKNPYDSYLDAPVIVDGYEPKNFDKGYRGWMTMQQALTSSVNIVALKVMLKVGFEPTIKLANDMGIKSDLKPMYSLALGSNEVNLLELTSAYGTFANKGLHIEPHGIRRIFNRQGKEIWNVESDNKFNAKRALDSDSAAITTHMLRRVVTQGTGGSAGLHNRPVAGKTGTTDDVRDLWFIGYIPQMVTGVWLGNDDNKSTRGSSTTAAYTWRDFMKNAVEGMSIEQFPPRPKLKGRKSSIKAKPIKPKKLINRPIPKKGDEDSEGRNSRRSSRRRRRRSNSRPNSSQNSLRRRLRRRLKRNSSEVRRYRRRRSTISSPNNSGSSRSRRSTKQTPVRTRRVPVVAPRSPRPKTTPRSTPSWRERLKPN
ncbi:transglycosylase domain-containing protein [Mastigocoleus sp. MO_188.B34]|uniref:transglycosylase domain-containing protein n=1 Tax=Mastigocoleus sp. MO_188.B34 TaxID=3036635 RepID=UPI002632B8DB|nr:penicillin-binding protein 1A [Mastigocoleus sp. MO_188.B34]MDJ0695737.1 penicillin-binding protein 1A [Mastigocoleus sp. MO_188.B34]